MPDPPHCSGCACTFCKQRHACALLSHLEVARALERAVRRAGLPYAVRAGVLART